MPDAAIPAPASAHVTVNGQAQAWHPGLSVADLVACLVAVDGRDAQAVATALNGRFIARSLRTHTLLQPGDDLACFEAIVGG